MAAWRERADQLLFEGESIEERVAVGTGDVIVTSHRVLVFTPDLAGANYRTVDRPNVTGVAKRTDADRNFLRQGLRAGLFGLLLLGMGLVVDFGALVGDVDLSTAGTGRLGIGGMLGMVQSMMDLLASLDEYMRLVGALLLLFALVPLAVYAYGRDRQVVLTVAGEDDVPVGATADEDALERLRAAVLPEGVSGGGPDGPVGRLRERLS